MLEHDNLPSRWLAWALASLAVGLLSLALYLAASYVSPRLFRRTFVLDTGRGTVELKRGASEEDVRQKLGKPKKDEAMAVRGFRRWTYDFGKGVKGYELVFEDGKLDAVTREGEHRPGPWSMRRGRRL
jgi:hypothetical protein